MKKLGLFLLLLVACFSCPCLVAQEVQDGEAVSDDPGKAYADAHILRTKAEQAYEQGKLAEAYAMMEKSLASYQEISRRFPEWNREMITYRMEKTRETLEKWKKEMGSKGVALPEQGTTGEEPVKRPSEIILPDNITPMAPPDANVMPVFPPGGSGDLPTGPGEEAFQEGLLKAVEEFQKLKAEYKQLGIQNQEMAGKYQQLEREYQSVFGQVALSAKRADEAEQKALKLEADLKKEQEKGGGREAAIKAEWEAMTKEIADAKKAQADAEKKLADLPKQLEEQMKELEALKAELAAAKEKEKSMEAAAGEGGLQKLLDDKKRLETELVEAREKIDTLMKSSDDKDKTLAEKEKMLAEKDKEILGLKTQLGKVQEELEKLKEENHTATLKVAELTADLREARADLETVKKEPKMDPLLSQENKLLQEFIIQQIRQQTRVQEAKTILMAELRKIEGVNEDLLAKVDEVAVRPSVSPEVLKALKNPEIEELLKKPASVNVHTTVVAKVAEGDKPAMPPKPAPPTPEASANAALLTKASESFNAGRYAEAETSYLDYLRGEPKNSQVLASLAVVQMRMEKMAEAEVHLQKAVTYDKDNAFAHFMLGVLYFNGNKISEAKSSLESSVRLDEANAKARHYLGIIASRQGDEKQAESELATAIALDPAYASAHFNLAVLYATMTTKNWDKSRDHYLRALAEGAKRDNELEKLLESKFPDMPKLVQTELTKSPNR